MPNSYKRKKQPELTRQALLQHAARIASEKGLHAVTMQAVADAAGVTKGGLTHHFSSKQALVEAIFKDLTGELESVINQFIAKETRSYGVFTRAYIQSVTNQAKDTDFCVKASLCALMIGDHQLRKLWAIWFERLKSKHKATDSDDHLQILQFAADGLWLAEICDERIINKDALIAALMAASKAP